MKFEFMRENFPKGWLTVSEASDELSVCSATVRKWILVDGLGARRAGAKGRWMIPIEELESFVARGRKETTL